MSRIRKHLTYANVISTLCLFLLLGGGTALAAYVVSSNSQIGPGTVSGHKPSRTWAARSTSRKRHGGQGSLRSSPISALSGWSPMRRNLWAGRSSRSLRAKSTARG